METYYIYNPETFEFIGEDDVIPGRIPANGTTDAPPKINEGEKAVMVKGSWEIFSPKQWTQHLILLGHKNMSENEIVNDSGEIVPKPKTQAQIKKEKLLEIDDSLFQLMFQRFLTTTYTLGIMVTLLFLPSFNEPLPLLTWQSQMRLHAKFVDRLTDYYQVDTYQFIGFNGPQFYGHTEQLPKGPVFSKILEIFKVLILGLFKLFFRK
jgi:hypothetical protein